MAMTHHLLAALAALSTVLAIPSSQPPASHSSCTSRSLDLRDLSIESFVYHASYTFSTPAHQIASGSVSLNLINNALSPPAAMKCNAESSQLENFFYGNLNYNCTAADDRLGGTFAFSYPTGMLAVNETWWCRDEGARFEAEGSAKLGLSCEESRWQNQNWTMGQIYSTREITCTEAKASVPITSMSGVA